MGDAIYQADPDQLPDDAFEKGRLGHLRSGTKGRLRDPRRTPVSVLAVDSRGQTIARTVVGESNVPPFDGSPARLPDYQTAFQGPPVLASEPSLRRVAIIPSPCAGIFVSPSMCSILNALNAGFGNPRSAINP